MNSDHRIVLSIKYRQCGAIVSFSAHRQGSAAFGHGARIMGDSDQRKPPVHLAV